MKKLTITTALLLCAVLIYGQWTYTNLSEPKSFMGSAALGNKAYFAGGYNGTDFLTTVEAYDITTGTCSVIGDLSVPREIIGGGISCGSKVFFPGGFDWSVSYSTVDIYNTLTGQWTVEALSQPRFSMTSVSYHDTVMFAGGFIYPSGTRTSRVDFYNVQTDAWSTAELSIAREGIASAVVGDIAIFAGGLVTVSSSTNRVDIYNFTSKTWSMATLSQARGMANAVTVGNKVIIAGGVISNNNPTDVVDIYDYGTNTWSTATISDPRAAQTNGANISGKAFFAGGGEFTGNGYRFPSDVIDIYDPASNTWSVDHLTQGLINHSVVGIGGYLIVAGGENDDNEYLSQIEVYHDPTFFEVPADYSTIQEAINAASEGDTVLVEDGTYFENINLFGRKPFLLASNFFFDGDTNHINNTIINGSQPVDPDKGSVVTFESGEDTTSVLCGFTITGGSGTIVPVASARMGGGVGIFYSGAKLIHNHIEYNTTTTEDWACGGGLQAGGPMGGNPLPWIVLKNNRINHNQAISTGSDGGAGGGIICYYNLIMHDNEVSHNLASGHLGADGGGVNVAGAFGPIELNIKRNLIAGNEAATDLGTSNYAALGGGMSLFLNLSGIIADNTITNNSLEAPSMFLSYAPGVFIQEITADNFIFENNLISQNISNAQSCHGGGLCLYKAGGIYKNNVIQNNSASHGGGGFIEDSQLTYDTAILINNTIADNNATTGGGLYLQLSDVLIMNSIVWGNTASTSTSIYMQQSKLEVWYSDIEGETLWPGEGNINLDPGFIDDFLHIDEFSLCTDAGTESFAFGGNTYYAPLYDLEGTPRPWHYLFDMGAYECDIFTGVTEEEVSGQPSAACPECEAGRISFWPNPTSGSSQFAVRSSQEQHVTLRIYDIHGREVLVVLDEVMPAGEKTVELDMSGLPAGVYFYRLAVSGQQSAVSGKIVKH